MKKKRKALANWFDYSAILEFTKTRTSLRKFKALEKACKSIGKPHKPRNLESKP